MKKLAVFLFFLCLGQSVFSASVSYPPLIAVGETSNLTNTLDEPLIAVSHDDGVTWAAQGFAQYPGAFPTILNASACGTGAGSTAVCVAGGMYVNASADSTLPLIASSVDGGDHWTGQTFSQYPAGTVVNASCTGAGSATTCVLTGYLQNATESPFIGYTTNGAATWAFAPLTNEQAGLFSVSCSGSGATAICVAVGQDNANNKPLTASSSNGGANWSFQDLMGVGSQQGLFWSVSCSAGNPSVCVAVGSIGGGLKSQALLASSVDGGRTWQSQTLPNIDQSLSAVSCTQSNTNTVCIAVGANGHPQQPLLVSSTYNGTTWGPWIQSVASNIPNGAYSALSCATNASASVVCAVLGSGHAGHAAPGPIIGATAIYTNGAWALSAPQVLTLPQNSNLSGGVSCTNSVTSAVLCFAAGSQQGTSSNAPLVVTNSYDKNWSGWAAAQISNLPYPAGFFAGTGAGESTASGLVHRKNQ